MWMSTLYMEICLWTLEKKSESERESIDLLLIGVWLRLLLVSVLGPFEVPVHLVLTDTLATQCRPH